MVYSVYRVYIRTLAEFGISWLGKTLCKWLACSHVCKLGMKDHK